MKHLSNVNSLCMVLGLDFKDTVCKIHPTLNDPKASKDVSNDTIEKMATAIQSLQEVKIQRMQKVCTPVTVVLLSCLVAKSFFWPFDQFSCSCTSFNILQLPWLSYGT